jgi:hypothetical protein
MYLLGSYVVLGVTASAPAKSQGNLNTYKTLKQINMTFPFPYKPLREQISYKQHEAHIMQSRDALCAHYRLNKSDLIKYLIKKEALTLRTPTGLLEEHQ